MRQHSIVRRLACLIAPLAVAFTSGISHGQWTVRVLSTPTAENSSAYGGAGLRAAGEVSNNGIEARAALWNLTSGSRTILHPAGATNSQVSAMDSSMQVGYAQFDLNTYAGIWTGTAASWLPLHPIGATSSRLLDVSDGQQVGWATINGNQHASLWTSTDFSWVDLNPTGATTSTAYCVHAGEQGGSATIGGGLRAGIWRSSAASWVLLHPTGSATESVVYGNWNGQQVGYIRVPVQGRQATLWSGTAASRVNLHPAGASASYAMDTCEGYQVGYRLIGTLNKACAWRGTAASFEDLHQFVPTNFSTSIATKAWRDGQKLYVSGYGYNFEATRNQALLWSRDLPCIADFNEDGGIDGADVEAFFIAWESGATSGDVNEDGGVDGQDIECFIVRWEAGGCG